MSGDSRSPLGRILPRQAGELIEAALADTRVVLVNGARQAGKSTLVRQISGARGAEWRSLDRAVHRRAAEQDPTGFVDTPDPLVIDEIQRVPELLLAIKERVDEDSRPGQFLLTGSARLLSLRSLPDALPGRMETVELWPFAQSEIDATPGRFVDLAFARGGELRHRSAESRRGYAERLIRGGFPEAVARADPRRRARFFTSYLGDLVNRDVVQLSEIERASELRALMRLLADRSGQLVVTAALASGLAVSRDTVRRYLGLLEEVFLIRRVPAWSRSISTRATGTPKVAFTDSGVAASLLGVDAHTLLRPGSSFGPLLEGFVLMELARQLTWCEQRVELFHYRTRDQLEVDAVLENTRGEVVGVEVKSAAAVRGEDFRGLRHLQERLGEDFLVGLVLYTGDTTLSFGPRLRAMPISVLWEAGP